MIIFKKGSLFDSQAKYIVNPVNCVGIMGKGLALEFKIKYPKNYKCYVNACKEGFTIGDVLVYHDQRGIINFPTKEHWKNPSKIEYIVAGCVAITKAISPESSIAMPLIGCGLGGLKLVEVLPIIEKYLKNYTIEIWSKHGNYY